MKASKVVFLVFLILMSLGVVNTQPVRAVGAAENTWTSVASMPTPRSALGVAVVNGKIYAIGGEGYFNINEEYDPVTNTWTTKTRMPTARAFLGIAVYQNRIYCVGGVSGPNLEAVGTVEVYDPLTDSWETKTPMPTPRASMAANVVGDKIYLIGGARFSPGSWQNFNVNEMYDPITDTWATMTSMPTPASFYASAVLDNRIYVIGGYPSRYSNQIYTPENDSWSNGASPPLPEVHAAGAATTGVMAPKRIYVIGGDGAPFPSYENLVYDPETDAWSAGAGMHRARNDLGVAVVDDVLYAIGGVKGAYYEYYGTNERYVPIGYGTVPPIISIVSPENKTYTVNNVSLTFTLNKPVSWMGYSLDRQTNVAVTGNITLTNLPNGYHNLTVYANYTLGNMGASETIYFTIKTQQSGFLGSNLPVEYGYGIVAVAAASIIAVVGYMLLKRKKKGGNK